MKEFHDFKSSVVRVYEEHRGVILAAAIIGMGIGIVIGRLSAL